MSGYVVRARFMRYLERSDGESGFGWIAAGQEHAAVFTHAAALALASFYDADGATVCEDYRRREPEFDLGDLDGDVFCHRHGKVKPMSEYGIRYGGCEDCEPPEPDGEAFRGGEAAAYERERQAEIQRTLK